MFKHRKLRSLKRAAFLLPSLLGVVALAGCEGQENLFDTTTPTQSETSPAVADNASLIEASEQALAAYPNASWSANGYVVNICFIDSGFATAKTQIRDAINGSWGANSGLSIRWPANLTTDLCPQSPAGSGNIAATYLPISLHKGTSGGDWGGACQPGYGGRMLAKDCNPGNTVRCQCTFSTADMTSNPAAFLGSVAIHEIGHGLGLPHEHQRSDRPSNIASTCVDPNTDPNKWTGNGNYTLDSSLIRLTRYDGTMSIMSYCRDWDQNGKFDDPPYTPLSNMDRLGIEMMYPKSYKRMPVIGGFGNAGGSKYIVRNDTNTQMYVDWVWLGGLTSAFSNVRWTDGAGAVLSTAVSPTRKFTGNTTVNLSLSDAFGRAHSGGSVSVVPNNGLHTAVALATVFAIR